MSTTTYTKDGKTYFIGQGLAYRNGAPWFTLWKKSDGKGGSHRVVTKNLPTRDTREEAQADLDTYANTKGWFGEPAAVEEIANASLTEAQPRMSDMVREGDMIILRSVQMNKDELMFAYDKRLASLAEKVTLKTPVGDIVTYNGQHITPEQLNSEYRFYMTRDMVSIGDKLSYTYTDGRVEVYEVINKTETEIRLKPEFNNSASHPNWNTFSRYDYSFVKRVEVQS